MEEPIAIEKEMTIVRRSFIYFFILTVVASTLTSFLLREIYNSALL